MIQQFRPPSVPLITVDPYFSVWSAADHLYDHHTVHWTNKRNSMLGMIKVDGKTSRFMGKIQMTSDTDYEEPPAFLQKSLKVDPLTTTYLFEGDGIELEMKFVTPLLLNDLDLLSRPASYLTFNVRSVDGNTHDVQIYFDVSGDLCVNTVDQPIVWGRKSINEQIVAMYMGTEEQPVLKRVGDDTRIDWGYCYLASPQVSSMKTVIHSYDVRKQFAETGQLLEKDDEQQPRPVQSNPAVMAALVDIGEVDETQVSHFLVLAYDDIHAIEYFNQPLNAYWRRNGMTFEEMISLAISQYGEIQRKCEEFNRELINESQHAGREKYKDLLALSYRQAIAAHKLVVDENGEVLFLSKENFSNGCIATVDVSYPSIPLFLRYNPEFVKAMMRPIFRYAASEEWTFHFAPHDVGCYPKANGQVYGENKLEYQMPIEECGNMLIMAASVCIYAQNASFAKENWVLLTEWANYLIENGLDPENQLCTDDFAGHLAHNANLSIKAILGIGAYSIMCKMLDEKDGEVFYQKAKEMASQWVEMAASEDHFKLTFDSTKETWSMKYNLVWDRLFGLNLFPEEIVEKEIPYYLSKQNKFGTPLDNRNTYTKSDWLVWCASLANSQNDFEQMITPLWHFLNESSSRVPFTDWYDTITGKQINFQNRSVVGGLFIKLLKPVGISEYHNQLSENNSISK
ncbi:glutaminase [Bacillus sp. SA1-12]|uniref:glutaminase family protein n=1 Tax=Bacillus sp. SA1-12 TaxID=1455638 RepID=UPI0006257B21|nr:glutaminase family protein [Bacillus sp. SA1-12]KKI93438.1 glutaminase [Bacillus sp. SA1-12]